MNAGMTNGQLLADGVLHDRSDDARFGRRPLSERETVAHDLRMSVTVVVGRVQLLRRRLRRGDDLARVASELEAIEEAISRLITSVEQLDALERG